MKQCFVFLVFFCLCAGGGFALADEGRIEVPFSSTLLIKTDGDYRIEASPGQTGVEYTVSGLDRKGNPAVGLILAAKPTAEGTRVLINKKPGSTGYVGTPKVTLRIPPVHSLKLLKSSGNFTISGLAGLIEGRLISGQIHLDGCSGAVNLQVDKGQFSATNHRSQRYPFVLHMKRGQASVELADTPHAGPGKIHLESGRLTWRMQRPVPLSFYGEVKNGLVTCNLPLNRKTPNVILFSSLEGASLWQVQIDKGVLDVHLPDPKLGTAPARAR